MEKELRQSPKAIKIYEAVYQLLEEGCDLGLVRVKEITEKAGIGKGTAYEYFDSKEEILFNALLYILNKTGEAYNKTLQEKENFIEKVSFLIEQMIGNCAANSLVAQLLAYATRPGNLESLQKFHEQLRNSELEAQKMEVDGGISTTVHGKMGHFPLNIIYNMVVEAMEKGEITDRFPVSYVVNSLAGKLLMLAIEQKTPENQRDCSLAETSKFFLESIELEFGKH